VLLLPGRLPRHRLAPTPERPRRPPQARPRAATRGPAAAARCRPRTGRPARMRAAVTTSSCEGLCSDCTHTGQRVHTRAPCGLLSWVPPPFTLSVTPCSPHILKQLCRRPQDKCAAKYRTTAELTRVGNLFGGACAWQNCGSMLHAHAVWRALTTPIHRAAAGRCLAPLAPEGKRGREADAARAGLQEVQLGDDKGLRRVLRAARQPHRRNSSVTRRQQYSMSLASWSLRHGHCNEAELVTVRQKRDGRHRGVTLLAAPGTRRPRALALGEVLANPPHIYNAAKLGAQAVHSWMTLQRVVRKWGGSEAAPGRSGGRNGGTSPGSACTSCCHTRPLPARPPGTMQVSRVADCTGSGTV